MPIKSHSFIDLLLYLIHVISPVSKKPLKFVFSAGNLLTADSVDPERLAVWNAFLTVAKVATVPVDVLMRPCWLDVKIGG